MGGRRGRPRQALSISGALRVAVACILALDRSAEIRAAAEDSSVSASTIPLDDPVADSTGDQQEVFEDLPEGFHDDVDSITLAVGGHHTCALEYRPGVDFGGPVRCWGRDDWGQSTPSDDIFVQVRRLLRSLCLREESTSLLLSKLLLHTMYYRVHTKYTARTAARFYRSRKLACSQ